MRIRAEDRLQAAETKLRRRNRQLAKVYGQESRRELWERGFLVDKRQLYDFELNGYDVYLTDLQREMTRAINAEYSVLLNDKLIFHRIFQNVAQLPKLIGFTDHKKLRREAAASNIEFYAKPVRGGGGGGVFRGSIAGDRITIGEEAYDWARFTKYLVSRGKRYLITEAVRLHPELAAIYPGSVNTVRVLMMRDPGTLKGFIAAAVFRVGSAETGGLDNFTRGGLSCPIDLKTGRIGPGARKKGPVKNLDRHPNTAAAIAGTIVPHWAALLETVQRAFEFCPQLSYVGWDIIVTEAGPVILEGNSYSDVNLLQVHQPLLADSRVHRFYEHHGILRVQPVKDRVPPPENLGAKRPRVGSDRLSGRRRRGEETEG